MLLGNKSATVRVCVCVCAHTPHQSGDVKREERSGEDRIKYG